MPSQTKSMQKRLHNLQRTLREACPRYTTRRAQLEDGIKALQDALHTAKQTDAMVRGLQHTAGALSTLSATIYRLPPEIISMILSHLRPSDASAFLWTTGLIITCEISVYARFLEPQREFPSFENLPSQRWGPFLVGRDAEVLEAQIYDPLGLLAREERHRVFDPLIRLGNLGSAALHERHRASDHLIRLGNLESVTLHERYANVEAEIVRRESMLRGIETEYVLPYVDLTANAFMRSAAEYGPQDSERHVLSWAVSKFPTLRKAQFIVLLRGGEIDGEKETIWPKYLHGILALADLDGGEI